MILPVGIDVSKENLEIYLDGKSYSIENNQESIECFFKWQSRDLKVVMEATGKYHRLAHEFLHHQKIPVMLVNPYQTKHFAKSQNVLCKTDKVDAKILHDFAQRMDFKETACQSELEQELQELVRHLEDLKKYCRSLEAQASESKGFIAKSKEKLKGKVIQEIKSTEEKLKQLVSRSKEPKAKSKLLMTIPGIGLSTAIVLLALLKELGCLNKRQVAALAGLAPINNDSGNFSGKRRIRGGRHDLRALLYMPVVGAATQHNVTLMAFYQRLLAAGKLKKVALTACMRKMIVWANAILASGLPWQENKDLVAQSKT